MKILALICKKYCSRKFKWRKCQDTAHSSTTISRRCMNLRTTLKDSRKKRKLVKMTNHFRWNRNLRVFWVLWCKRNTLNKSPRRMKIGVFQSWNHLCKSNRLNCLAKNSWGVKLNMNCKWVKILIKFLKSGFKS